MRSGLAILALMLTLAYVPAAEAARVIISSDCESEPAAGRFFTLADGDVCEDTGEDQWKHYDGDSWVDMTPTTTDSDTANEVVASDGAGNLQFVDALLETELDTESELESQLSDVSDVLTNADFTDHGVMIGDGTSSFSEVTLPDCPSGTAGNSLQFAQSGNSFSCVDNVAETELDTESELETQLGDVTDVYTNNDDSIDPDQLSGDTTDDDLIDPVIGGLGRDASSDTGLQVFDDGVAEPNPRIAFLSSYDSLSAADSALDGTPTYLYVDANDTLTGNVTLDDIVLVAAGGVITTNGNTLTMTHPPQGFSQLFTASEDEVDCDGCPMYLEWFGGDGTDDADDKSAWEVAGSVSGHIVLRSGHEYDLDTSPSAIDSLDESGVSIVSDGEGQAILNVADDFSANGRLVADDRTISGSTSVLDNSFTIDDASGLAIGQVLCINSDSNGVSDFPYAEIDCALIDAISGTTITLEKAMHFAYGNGGETVTVRIYEPDPLVLKNINLAFDANLGGLNANGFGSIRADNFKCSSDTGTKITNVTCVETRYSTNVTVTGLHVSNVLYGWAPGSGTLNTTITNVVGINASHPVDPRSFSDNTVIDGFFFMGNSAGVNSHPAFNVCYKNGYSYDDDANIRTYGGCLENVTLRTDTADSDFNLTNALNDSTVEDHLYFSMKNVRFLGGYREASLGTGAQLDIENVYVSRLVSGISGDWDKVTITRWYAVNHDGNTDQNPLRMRSHFELRDSYLEGDGSVDALDIPNAASATGEILIEGNHFFNFDALEVNSSGYYTTYRNNIFHDIATTCQSTSFVHNRLFLEDNIFDNVTAVCDEWNKNIDAQTGNKYWNGSAELLGGKQTHTIKTVSSSAGTTLTASNAIPDGCMLLSVRTEITTGFGTTNGLTDFDIGDGSDVDRFGNQSTLTDGASTDNSDFTATTAQFFTSANNIVLTGNGDGGDEFDGDGEIVVAVDCVQ